MTSDSADADLFNKVIDILRNSRDGNDLTPLELRIIELAVNHRLNHDGRIALDRLHVRVVAKPATDPCTIPTEGPDDMDQDSSPSPGLWQADPTLLKGQLNLITTTTRRAYHVGTLICGSGSQHDLARFRTNAAFIIRACNSHAALLDALEQALRALNAAPRFRFEDTDSYKIAATIERAIARARS
jgi:hypothetical protein